MWFWCGCGLRDYAVLCENMLKSSCFRDLEAEAERVRVLVSDLTLGTQYNYLVTLKKYVEFAKSQGKNPFKFDLVVVRKFLEPYKATTRQGYAFRLRRIFEFNGEIAKFKVQHADNDLPEVLSDAEVNRIVEATETMKWRLLVRLTYEGAMREHEVLGLKIKHVKFDKHGAEVFIPSTKSEVLWLRVISSAPLLQAWLEQHPDRDNREAWLFPGRKKNKPLTYIAFYLALKRTAKRIGIEKKVFPHLLRHSRLAWLKKYGAKMGISDSVICQLYGRWSRKNAHRMLDRYGRIEPHEANEIVLKAYGKLEEQDFVEPSAKPQTCVRCKKENDALAKYCRVCGMVLDERTAQLLMEKERKREELMELLSDPKVLARLKGEDKKR